MGQSPVEDVTNPFAGIEPLMYTKTGRPVWPIMGGSGEDEGGDDAGDGADDEGDDDEDEGDEPKDKSKSSSRVKELSDENSRRRNEAKELRKQLDAAAAKLKEHEDAKLGETEKTVKERDELKAKAEALEAKSRQLALQVAFLQDRENDWHNPKTALRLLELDGVEIDDEGEVKGLDVAIKKLVTENPYLVKTSGKDDEDAESGAQQQPSGSPVSKKAEKQRAALEQKYRLGS